MLKKYHPIYINTHFNHPNEVTPQAKEACERLAGAGIPLGCQTVLMKGVNDDPVVLKELMHKLLMMRVRPYYLYQADLTRGTNHFRTRVETGLEIMQALRGYTTGFAVPQFVIDAPGRRREDPPDAGLCGEVRREGNRAAEFRGEEILLSADESALRQGYSRDRTDQLLIRTLADFELRRHRQQVSRLAGSRLRVSKPETGTLCGIAEIERT